MNAFNAIADAAEALDKVSYEIHRVETFVLPYQPRGLEAAFEWLEKEGALLSQRELKCHPIAIIRKANRLRKRATDAALGEQAAARFGQRADTRLGILAEMVKQAAAVEDPKEAAEAAATVREMTAAFKRAERNDARAPLYALRAEKHDAARGSRAIRRKVSHDFRKGRKPDPDHGTGSVRLDAGDLLELHDRFAANVLSPEVYNAALAEAQALGRLRHLAPLVPKAVAEEVNEERRAA